ncbi:MAG: AMIN domain-containing protein [Terriglobales bacterium]
MRAAQKQTVILMLLLSFAAAQNTDSEMARIRDIVVTREGADLRVTILVSSPVEPVVAERHAERLVLQLPNTTYFAKRIDVGSDGVRAVRTKYDGVDGTEIVVDMDHAHPYVLTSDKNQIVLTLRSTLNSPVPVSRSTAVASSSTGQGGTPRDSAGTPPAGNQQTSIHTPSPVQPSVALGISTTVGVHSQSPSSSSLIAADSRPAQAAPNPQPAARGGTTPRDSRTSASQTSSPQASTPQVSTHGLSVESSTALDTSTAVGVHSQSPSSSGLVAADNRPAQVDPVPQNHPIPPSPQALPTPQLRPVPEVARAVNNVPAPVDSENKQPTLRLSDPSLRTAFKVKYVAEGVAYLDGGRSAGLKEGVKLEIQQTDLPTREGAAVDPSDPRVVAELEVTATAETSAVSEIHSPKRPVQVGDIAYLSSGDAEALVQQTALSSSRKYPAVVSFTEGDPLNEEAREEVPRPPLPSVNRARGRMGFDYMGTTSHGPAGMTSSDVGVIFRGDITRINGSYWNLSGYWRGRLTSQTPAAQQTLQDLINRTYHLSMTYDNPNSAWVAGFGRLYLPWAASLDTIDGGYFGRRLSKVATLGLFGGSTPDPTSWDYSPDRVIGGGFINFEGGDYARLHYSTTMGAGVSMLQWQLDKPFGFLENTISYTQHLSIYDALQVDSPSSTPAVPASGPGLSRNFLTVRVQPHPRLEFDFNHTYFRDVPTFDPQLVGTGLLDKYLFQGFSGGARFEVWKQISVYTQLGTSNRSGDAKNSLNELYGITFGHLPWFGLRADFHYARFNSSFGDGSYKSFSVSRNFSDNFRLEILAGEQAFSALLTTDTGSKFVTANVETNLGPHYFLQGGYTINRGGQLNYDQWMTTLGYRFDSKARHKE